jgi:two-component sensor histidine kinase
MALQIVLLEEAVEVDSRDAHTILRMLKHLVKQNEQIMSAISDLQAATADLQAADTDRQSAVLAAIADIKSLPATDAQIVPLTAVITKVAANTRADSASLLAAIAPPAPVPPAPAPA